MAFQAHLQGKGFPVDDKDEQPNIDEFVCHLLDALFPTSGPFFWKGEIVLRLKVPQTGAWGLTLRMCLKNSSNKFYYTGSIIVIPCRLRS